LRKEKQCGVLIVTKKQLESTAPEKTKKALAIAFEFAQSAVFASKLKKL
jgi:hypothetical protein